MNGEVFLFVFFLWGGGGVGSGGGGGGQGRCEQRSGFLKIQFFFFGGGGGGSGRGGGGQGGCERRKLKKNRGGGVGGVRWGVRLDVIVQCTKRYCTILRKLKKCVGGGGRGNICTQSTLNALIKKEQKKKKKKNN